MLFRSSADRSELFPDPTLPHTQTNSPRFTTRFVLNRIVPSLLDSLFDFDGCHENVRPEGMSKIVSVWIFPFSFGISISIPSVLLFDDVLVSEESSRISVPVFECLSVCDGKI